MSGELGRVPLLLSFEAVIWICYLDHKTEEESQMPLIVLLGVKSLIAYFVATELGSLPLLRPSRSKSLRNCKVLQVKNLP